jgi:Ca-activated chloride channel family protein
MRGKRAGIVAAAMSFVEASNPHDEMFVVHFNEEVRFGLSPPELFTNDPIQVRGALLRMISDGQTALYDAVAQAIGHFGKGRHNRKALLVVSDGGDNASQRELKETLQLVHSSHVVVYTISLYDPSNRDQKPRVLRRLSRTSGGESFFPKELEQVGPICHSIATDIRNQYLLAYRSSNSKRDGAFRRVRVLLDVPARKNLVVRTREGYFAPNDSGVAGRASIVKSGISGGP